MRSEVVAPVRLSGGPVQRLDTIEVTDAAGIIREMKELRKRVKPEYYRKETADMLRAERERYPPRRYPRV